MVLIDHAAGLGGLAGGVADVETLDAQRVQVVQPQVQRIDQRAGSLALRTLLGQQARQRDLRPLLGHLQPSAALLTRLMLGVELDPQLLAQCRQQFGRHRMAQHQTGRRRHAQVMLGDEGFEHLLLDAKFAGTLVGLLGRQRRSVLDMGRKIRAVAKMAAAANHRQVDAGPPARDPHRQDVDVAIARRQAALIHALLVQHPRQRADLVAHLGRALEFQRVRESHHLSLQRTDHLARIAQQEPLGMRHVATIVLGRDQADARA